MICPTCLHSNREDELVCRSCGSTLPLMEVPSAVPGPSPAQAPVLRRKSAGGGQTVLRPEPSPELIAADAARVFAPDAAPGEPETEPGWLDKVFGREPIGERSANGASIAGFVAGNLSFMSLFAGAMFSALDTGPILRCAAWGLIFSMAAMVLSMSGMKSQRSSLSMAGLMMGLCGILYGSFSLFGVILGIQ